MALSNWADINPGLLQNISNGPHTQTGNVFMEAMKYNQDRQTQQQNMAMKQKQLGLQERRVDIADETLKMQMEKLNRKTREMADTQDRLTKTYKNINDQGLRQYGSSWDNSPMKAKLETAYNSREWDNMMEVADDLGPSEGEDDVRSRKIADAKNILISQYGMEPEQAKQVSIGMTDGWIDMKTSDDGTKAVLTNTAGVAAGEEGSTVFLEKKFPEVPTQEIPPEKTLMSQTGEATGIASGFFAATERIPGKSPSEVERIARETRTEFTLFQEELIRSLAKNPKVPTTEQAALRKLLDIEPSIFTSPEGLQARLQAVKGHLEYMLGNQEGVAADRNISDEDRAAAKLSIRHLKNAIAKIGERQPRDNSSSGWGDVEWVD